MFQNIKRPIVLLFCLFTLLEGISANDNYGYTEEHPLIIVSDWDFRPFEFINVEGKPTGYNVDVLDLILDQLGIPHKFVMQEWHAATSMFKRREADLIHALYFFYKDSPYISTHKYINYYNLIVARRTDTKPLHQLNDLKSTDTLLLKKDDYAALALANMGRLPFATEYHSPKDGLAGIRQGRYKYYIWGEIPLSHKIQELGLDSITLDEIDIPSGELRIIGYNKELIDLIDVQYTRLEESGELQEIFDRWFHPERAHDNTSPVVLLILGGLVLAAIIVFLLIRLVRQRVAMTVRESSDLGQMMSRVLNMGDYFVLEWDLKNNMLRNRYGNMLPQGEMKPEEFLTRMTPKEAEQLHALNAQLATGVISHFDFSFSFNQGTQEQPVWKVFYGNGIVEREDDGKYQSSDGKYQSSDGKYQSSDGKYQSSDGKYQSSDGGYQPVRKPKYLLYTTKDITEEVNEERRVRNAADKYKKMFDTNLVAMSIYDADGNFVDLNQKMRELCQIGNDDGNYFLGNSLFGYPNHKGIYLPGSREVIHACWHLNEPELGLEKYIEFRIRPVINDNDELVYYIVTNRDVTAERNMYLEQRKHDQQLHAVNEAVERYEQQLGYLLEESKMYIWNYILAEKVVYLTRTPGQKEFSETIEEYLSTVNANARQQAAAEMQGAIQQGKPYNTILPFDLTPLDNQPTWYAVSGIPIFNKDGKLTEYFGLSRNITELIQVQEQLRVETARAEDSGRLKAAFLANMTHEIRTPLNAIVGFSDLLPMIDDANEKKELMRIIRNNCDMLLRLISDILEASNIDSRPLAIDPTDVDFAQAFDEICQTLEQRVQTPGVEFIKDNPYTTFPTRLDKGRIQQVITNFVTNAVKYTQQGHIKVGYRVEEREGRNGIYVYCEDTGAGIPKEVQDSVFERFVKLNEFVQGTGLGLNICKSIAERCGGCIGVDSDGKGQGSTFWIWVPCSMNCTTNEAE